MNRSVIAWIAAGVLAVAAAAFAYVFWFAGGSGEPTTDLSTPELEGTTTSVAPASTSTEAGATTSQSEESSTVSFVIDQDRSTARFEIDEVLRGTPSHVVGTTNSVVGQVRVDVDDLSTVEFSEIIINARTLETDSERRNRAIRGPVILDSASDENELITLQVTSVEGLNGAAAVGDTFDFTVTGDLTIKGTTQAVTFDVAVTRTDETSLEGSATAEVTRDMFEIGIPSVPGVADVTNEVLIGLEFVATTG